MTSDSQRKESRVPLRLRFLQGFLWASLLGWGIGLGAKLFDLVVIAGAWSASPPDSFALLPYGPRYPVDPGDFFIPLSAVMALGALGTLLTGWRTTAQLRFCLWLPVVVFLIIWALTPTVFWPMIRQLYGTATGKIVATEAESIQLARRWVIWDSARVALCAIGFIAYVRAISLLASEDSSVPDRPRAAPADGA